MADNIIGIKFGVLGGTEGESARLIKSQLLEIAKAINLQVKVNINKTHFKDQLTSLKEELDKTLGRLNINVNTIVRQNANSNSSGSNETKKEIADNQALTKIVKQRYQEEVRLAKLKADGNGRTVNGILSSKKVDELKKQTKEQLAITGTMSDAEKEQINNANALNEELGKVFNTEKKIIEQRNMAAGTTVNKLQDKAQSLYTTNGFDDIIARSKDAKKLADDFYNDVQKAVKSSDGVTKKTADELNQKFLKTQAQIREIGRETDTTGNKIRKAFNGDVITKISAVLMGAMVRALRQVYQYVKEIDAAMTGLRIVTNATAKQMEQAADSIAKSARKIGSGIADLTNSTTTYARLGYNIKEAQTLAEKTTIYAKISGVNVDEATTNITGIIKAFNIGASGLESVLDQLIYVGNKFPISQAEIGEAMNNAASSLSANNNTLQQSIGIVSTANTTLQNISKSSTAVRTIAARISASTTELEELGESIDDLETFPNLEKKMNAYGIAITGANGQLLSTYEVLGNIAAKWKDLELNEQAAIATMIAGSRQQAAFYSIMQNWGDAEKIASGAESATGALMNAQEIRLNSIEGKFEKLKATWEEFSKNLLDSKLLKMGLTIVNGLATVLNWISGWFPATNVALTAISFIVLKLVTKGVNGSKEWGKQLKENITRYRELASTIETTTATLEQQKAKLQSHTDSFNTLGLNAAANPIIISELFNENIQNVQNFRDELITSYGATEENVEGIVEWAREQKSLTVQIEATSDALVKAQKAQSMAIGAIVGSIMGVASILLTVGNNIENKGLKIGLTIIAIVGAVVAAIIAGIKATDKAMKMNMIFAAISLAVSALIGLISTIKSVIPSLDNLKEKAKENKDAWSEVKDELKDVASKIKDVEEELNRLKSIETPTLTDEKDIKRLEQQLSILKQIEKMKKDAEERARNKAAGSTRRAIDKLKKKNKSALSNISSNPSASLDVIKEYADLLSGFEYGVNTELNDYFDDYYQILDKYTIATGSAVDAWSSILSRTKNEDAVKALREFANGYKNTSKITKEELEKLVKTKGEVGEFFDYLKSVGMWDGENWEGLIKQIGELRDKFPGIVEISLAKDIEVVTDKFEALSNALSDVEKNGVVSLNNLKTLAEKYPSILDEYFSKTADGYKLSEEYNNDSTYDILEKMAVSDLKSYQKDLKDAQAAIEELTEDCDDYWTALNNVAIAQDNLNTKEIEYASILREHKIPEETARLEKQKEALEKQLNVYKELIDIRKDLLTTYKEELNYQKEIAKKQKKVSDLKTQFELAKLDTSASGQARARELQKQLEEAQEELDEYTLERAVKDITAELEKSYNEYQKFIDGEVDKISEEIGNIAQHLKDILEKVEGIAIQTHTNKEMAELAQELRQKQNAGMNLGKNETDFITDVTGGNFASADKKYDEAKKASDSFVIPTTTQNNEKSDIAEKMQLIPGASASGMAKDKKNDRGTVKLREDISSSRFGYGVRNKGIASDLINAAYTENGYEDRSVFLYDGELYACVDGSVLKLGGADTEYIKKRIEKNKDKLGIYHTGGFVGDATSLKSNEEFAKLLDGEFVSTPRQMDTFIKKTLPNIATSGGNSIQYNAPIFEIKCESIDKSTLPDLETIINSAVAKMEKNMKSALSRAGYRK